MQDAGREDSQGILLILYILILILLRRPPDRTLGFLILLPTWCAQAGIITLCILYILLHPVSAASFCMMIRSFSDESLQLLFFQNAVFLFGSLFLSLSCSLFWHSIKFPFQQCVARLFCYEPRSAVLLQLRPNVSSYSFLMAALHTCYCFP